MSDDAPAARLSNVWLTDGGRNPYLHNVFVLLGIDDPDATDKEFSSRIARARKKIGSNVEWVVHGQAVEPTDVSRAEQLARQETELVVERLLAHTRHELDTQQFQQAIAALSELKFPDAKSLLPLPIRDLTFVAEFLPPAGKMVPAKIAEFPAADAAAQFPPRFEEEQIFDE